MKQPPPDPWELTFAPLERIFNRADELGRAGPAAGPGAARDGRTALGKLAWDLAMPANAVGLDHLVAWRMLRLKAASSRASATSRSGGLSGRRALAAERDEVRRNLGEVAAAG